MSKRAKFTVTYISKTDDTEKRKKVVEKFPTLEKAQERVRAMNLWADTLDLPDSSLDHIVVRRWGRKIYEQGEPND